MNLRLSDFSLSAIVANGEVDLISELIWLHWNDGNLA